MEMNIEKITIPVGSNPITIETGKLAKLADGAVEIRSGETVVLVTAVSIKNPFRSDMVPLVC